MNLPEDLSNSSLSPTIILVGPTAVGKTKISIQLAEKLSAEIVSADSRQIYKGMDIGTAKPSSREMKGVKHHFIDYISPTENFSAGEFGKAARDKILNIREKGKNVVVVGGSGLYLRALLYGMITQELKDDKIREELNGKLKKEGLSVLFQELESVDPELAIWLSVNDTQRILRGLEVYLMSGNKLSDLQKENEIPAPFNYLQIGLRMERKALYERINQRVLQMFDDGLIDEVKGLLKNGYKDSNALNAVGYNEVVQFLYNEIGKERMIELIQRNSRRYAKRQFTWFNKDRSINWFDLPDEGIVLKILNEIKKASAKW